jgi:hypothetical protein
MDLGGSPIGIFFRHASDQSPNFLGDLGLAAAGP